MLYFTKSTKKIFDVGLAKSEVPIDGDSEDADLVFVVLADISDCSV